jgi:hypothetical protein
MTPDPATAAWLSECWKPCPELPLGERLAKRMDDRKQQRDLEELGIHMPSPAVDEMCTGNPEKGAA